MSLDYLTLSIVIMAVSVITSIVMFILWKINRGVPGLAFWMVAGFLGVPSFAVQFLKPVIGAGNAIFLNNATAFALSLLVLEGILRFRGFGNAHRRRWVLAILMAGLVMLTWRVRNDATMRFLLQDPIYIAIYIVSAFSMLYRTQGLKRWIHCFSSTAFLLFALGIAYRWTLALRGGVGHDFFTHPLLGVVFLLAVIWNLGWTYGLVMAVNYHTQMDLEKAREEAIRDKISAEKANQTKAKLFSIIAHDLRSPFNGILGIAEIFANEELETTEDERRKLMKGLHRSTKDTYDLLANLLDWSHVNLEGIEIHKKNVPVFEVIDQVRRPLSNISDQKEIEIRCEGDHDLEVIVDRKSLELIVRNLLSNAIKYSHRGGTIAINLMKEDTLGRIAVVDKGLGMSEAQIASIMEDGHHASKPGTESEKGTGLGLNLVKEFVKKNDGTMEIKSQKGRGTRVELAFPVFRTAEER